MGPTRSRNGNEQVPADSAGDSDYIPSFELIPLEDGEPDAALFDFGPDLARPEGAPVAALPPWMDDETAAAEGDTRRSRRRAAQAVPRARRHRRPETEETVQIVSSQAPAVDDAAMEDTRDVDVAAVIAAEAAAERTRQAQARAGREVPSQPPARPERPIDPPVRIISSTTVPTQSAPPATAPAARIPQPSSPAKASRPAPPQAPTALPAAAEDAPAGRRNLWVAALLVAAAIGGGTVAWNISAAEPVQVTATGPLAGSAQAARDWLNANLGEKTSVLAPAIVAEGLKEVDFAKERVIAYPDGPSAPGQVPDWRCCNVLVVTAPSGKDIRNGLPDSLRNSYEQSRLMATFKAGGTVTEVRQVLDGTSDAVAASLATEQAARVAAGKEIAGIAKIKLSKAAKADLVAGRVDSRVMLALVGLSQLVDVSVLDFPIDPADKAAGAPARGMRIDKLGGKKVLDGSAEHDTAFDFLDAQVHPYRPLNVELVDNDGSQILDVTYDAPGTLGLITPRAKGE